MIRRHADTVNCSGTDGLLPIICSSGRKTLTDHQCPTMVLLKDSKEEEVAKLWCMSMLLRSLDNMRHCVLVKHGIRLDQ